MASLSRAVRAFPKNTLLPQPLRHGSWSQAVACLGAARIVRHSSHGPMSTTSNSRRKVTLPSLMSLHKKQEPITMMTAHDFPSAHAADQAGMDMILVGDSLAMVALGMEDTSELRLEDMILHCRSVARGTRAAFTVSPAYVLIL